MTSSRGMNRTDIFIYNSSPENWLQTALELDQTINHLISIKEKSFYSATHFLDTERIKRAFCSKPVYLLMTFSLENLIKGILVLRNPNFVNLGRLDRALKTHDLNRLTKLAEIKIINDEEKLLAKLTEIGTSSARYPIGLSENDSISPVVIVEDDEKIYKTLFTRLRDLLTDEFTEKGWSSGSDNPLLNTKPGDFKFVSLID